MTEGLPPTLIMLGSKDQFLAGCKKFQAQGQELGARVELEVYPGQPHAFFNNSPWTEKTALRADEFLQSIGYLTDRPSIDPPKGNPPGTREKRRQEREKRQQEE